MASASSICKVSLGTSSHLAFTPEAGALGVTHPRLNAAELNLGSQMFHREGSPAKVHIALLPLGLQVFGEKPEGKIFEREPLGDIYNPGR